MRGAGALGAAALLLAAGLAPGGARAATIEVEIDGIEPGGGRVFVALCQGGLSEAACRDGDSARAAGSRQRFVLQDVSPGTYALAAFQDLDGDGRLDRTPLGLPLEPYAFSGEGGRGARPDFARAAFAVREPGLAIRVRLSRALPPR
ncbi:DUF2141 domain-containing protein [Methylobacterium oxalidis]|uniref:DUF2141 domain-containing protein n=1 Tax=Methylobacterium oxalidis TaxID=944322 RepID=A0A512J1W2_9HYPH|nr:DUF2141 domain-containing protein [Methylobacterium oxalidis]GEP03950.1 hypothetical protein MOX02_19880 [Methylobacterium oxalidis]GJE33394.1 hypothetical protein LDDCCGHA_3594 [Methylobacterium oxalidis]GLS63982.1 hypothetical protein GCM10007888_23630 [Methylobacterium oxalidis]